MSTERLIRLAEVRSRTGLSGTRIYEEIKAKRFPAQVSIGPNSVAWRESEVDAWIAARIAARDARSAA